MTPVSIRAARLLPPWLSRVGTFLALVLGLAFSASVSRAQTGQLRTLTIYGTDAAPGTIDPNTDCSKDGDVTWLPAYALTPEHPWQESYPIAGTTRWIGRSADGQSAAATSSSNPEVLDFRIRFYAPTDINASSMTFVLDPDNFGDIYLNGTKLNAQQIVGPSIQTFTVSGANIQPGLNTIIVRLTDTGGWLGINYSVTLQGYATSGFQRLTAPSAVTNVTSSLANGSYKAGTVMPVQMTFTAAVNVTGTPQLTLATGSVNHSASYASGSGTTTLTFNYTVQPGDTSSDLDFASTSALGLNGGTIISSAADAQAANLTLPSPGASGSLGANKALVLDTTAPTLTVPANLTVPATSVSGATVNFAATASDAVTASPTITYSHNPGTTFPAGTTIVSVQASDAAGNVSTGSFTVTVQSITPVFASTGTTVLAEKDIPFSQAFSASGVPAPAFTTTGLPAGLSIGSASGVISGTATVQGTYPVTVTATNFAGSASQAITLTVGVPFTGASGFGSPSGAVTDSSGNLYVSSYNGNAVVKIAPSGAVTLIQSTVTGANAPIGLALDSAGNLYIAEHNSNSVSKVTPGGAISTFVATGLSNPWGLAFDSSGNLYISSSGAQSVVRVGPAGGTPATFVSSLSGPLGLAFDSSGNLYIANVNANTIVKATPGGAKSTFVATGVSGPEGLAFDSFGNLYVADNGSNAVSKVTPAGAVSTVVTGLAGPAGLALDSSGTLYVDNFNGTTVTHVAVEPAPVFTSASSATGTYGAAFAYTLTATNAPLSFGATGLPGGLTLSTSTGAITGTPTAVGAFPVQISATNAGTTTTGTLNLTINQATPVITWTAPAAILQGTALSSVQLDATTTVGGGFVYSPVAGTVLSTGAGQTLRTTFTPTDATDYKTVNGSTTITVDAPTVIASVTPPAAGDYNTGNPLTFTVNYSAAVTVNISGGTPTIALTIGGVTRQATYVSGSGTTGLVFKYVIQAGDTALNGISVASNVSLNGSTMKDGNGFAATTNFTAPDLSGVEVESLAPAITWIDSSKLAFRANFAAYTGTADPANQYQTNKTLGYAGTLPGWTASGGHAVHAVDLTGNGDYAIQIWQDNVLESPSFSTGNVAGTDYEVAFVAGPTVQYDSSQVTTAADGIDVKVLRADNSVLASYTYQPGAWQGEDLLVPVNFHYAGDGSGALHLEIGPSNFNSGHFGGAIDDLIVAPAAAFNPATIEATATSAAGAAVSFLTSAYSEISGDVTVTAAPVSGSTFALGSTAVTLSATDAAGNAVSQSFNVQVDVAQATITLTTPTNYVYDGTPKAATYTTSPAGLAVDLTYDGSASTAPTNAGSHSVSAALDPSQAWITAQAAAGSVAIAQANPTISVTPYGVTYDAASHTAAGTVKGAQSESLAGLDLSGTAHTNAGSYQDTWTFTDVTGNYTNASASVSDAIGQAAANLLVSGYVGIYDGAAHTASGSATGVGNANLSSLVSISGAFAHVPGGSVNWSFTDPAGNYQPATGVAAVAIAPASPTVSVTPYSLTYDGSAHTAAGSAKGVQNEPLSGLTLTGTTHTNAGTYSDSWTFTAATGDYTSANGSVSDQITAAPATFTVSPLSFVYNGTAQAPTVTVSPADATFTVSGAGSATNAGSYSLTANATGNYSGTSGATSWSIAPGAVTITWPAPAAITYGTPLSSAQLNATANVPGTFVYSPDVGAVLDVGVRNPLAVTFTPADARNYASATARVILGVAPNPAAPVVAVPDNQTVTATGPSGAAASYSVTATDALGMPIFQDSFESPTISGEYNAVTGGTGTVTYGAWNFSSTAGVISGASPAWGGTAPDDGNQYIWLQSENFNGVGQGSIETAQAMQLVAGQSYTVWWAQASRTNNGGALTYAVTVNSGSGSSQIFSRSTQNGEGWQYYAASFTAATSGPATVKFSTISAPNVDNSIFLDDISVTTTGAVPVTTDPVSGSTFAANTTTTVTAAAKDIAGTETDGSFTVTVIPQQVVITFTTPLYTYDGLGKAATATTSPDGLLVAFSYNGSANLPVSAGTYPVTATVDAGWAVGTTSGTLTIGQATATFVVTPYGVTYDGDPHTATGTATGVGGVDLSSGLNLAGTTRTNAGITVDAWTFADPNGNYASAAGTITDAIAKATPVVTATGYAVSYSGTAHTATGGVQGGLAGLNLAATTHTNAGTYTDTWTFTDVTGNFNNLSGTVTDKIAKANATVVVTPYAATYDGAAHTATHTATGVLSEPLAGVDVSGTTHTNAGSYATDAWTFTDNTGNYNPTGGTLKDVINQAAATITVTGYTVTFDDNAHTATATITGVDGTTLGGLVLSGTTHTKAGTFTDPWNYTDAGSNYASASGTVHDVINKANATISVTPYSVTYDGNAHVATGSATGAGGTSLSGLSLAATSHTAAGSYNDTWTFTDTTGNYNTASSAVSDVIAKAKATIVVTPYSVTYDGNAHTATGSAKGLDGGALAGLDLSGTTHTLPGSYADSWTFADATGNYQSVAATTITDSIGVTGLIRQGVTLNGNIDGSIEVLTGTADVLNGNSMISGDLIVPGTPTVIQNGHVTYGGTVDETGAAAPSNYQITLNGNVVLRHVIRRVNAIAMPVVSAPPAPTGSQNVTISKNGQAAPNWTTAKDVTLNGNVGSVTMPAGTYGNVVVNGQSTLVLGVAGATTPSVYNLQTLTVNGNAALEIVGPVVINSLNTFTANGNVGIKAHPDWLAVNVAAGGVTLNGNVTMYASVVAPTAGRGQVTINGNANLYGSVTADSLTVNGNGLLEEQ